MYYNNKQILTNTEDRAVCSVCGQETKNIYNMGGYYICSECIADERNKAIEK